MSTKSRISRLASELSVSPGPSIEASRVSIGAISIPIDPEVHLRDPTRIPELHRSTLLSLQSTLSHLQWLMQKELLGQDAFLLGPPGPWKRRLVEYYAALTQREVEYVCITPDTTESDLKQRREIKNGTSVFIDQAVVRAAIHGRLLILDGIEKAERNVLPVINNLLENREMDLDDGRFLMKAKQFDSLKFQENALNLENKTVRVSERFLVIALGAPVPLYPGYPLDPPLRSRFQCRQISYPTSTELFECLSKICPESCLSKLKQLILFTYAVHQLNEDTKGVKLFLLPKSSLEVCVSAWRTFSYLPSRWVLGSIYPILNMPLSLRREEVALLQQIVRRFDFEKELQFTVSSATTDDGLHFKLDGDKSIYNIHFQQDNSSILFKRTMYHEHLIVSLLHLLQFPNACICVLGPRGGGKSALVDYITRQLNTPVISFHVYKDLSSRDILQKRNTTPTGDTVWQNSPLVEAALNGCFCLLDGIDTLPFGTLGPLQQFITNREISLPDGSTLMDERKYEWLKRRWNISTETLTHRHVYAIPQSFRIIAVGRVDVGQRSGSWLNEEIMSMFTFLTMRPLSYVETFEILSHRVSNINKEYLDRIIAVAKSVRENDNENIVSLSGSLSLRQMIRIAKRVQMSKNDNHLFQYFSESVLLSFLPQTVRQSFIEVLGKHQIILPRIDEMPVLTPVVQKQDGEQYLVIGDIKQRILKTNETNVELVPQILFYDNPRQTEVMRNILMDMKNGEHILLIGNQGVGKNKIVDRLLQLLNLPRQYIQLHRDTTVQTLTSLPTIVDGKLRYEDSPLVIAAREGYILVVDESDKAPAHVTAIFKDLVENGTMLLGDGRRIQRTRHSEDDKVITLHPRFRIFMLANRPGFPFLGNDFYREIGDCLACHTIDNPDIKSELALLRQYAPSVEDDIIKTLLDVFTELRKMVNENLLLYPYSTRELVNIVKHMEKYPADGLAKAVRNVFDFDSFDKDTKELLLRMFRKHGIALEQAIQVRLIPSKPLEIGEQYITWLFETSSIITIKRSTLPLPLKGSWKLRAERTRHALDTEDLRKNIFSERLYQFQLPSRSIIYDAALTDDGRIAFICGSPSALVLISPDLSFTLEYDLYEYFPFLESQPFLTAIYAQQFKSTVGIFNPAENTLMVFELERGVVSAFVIGKGRDELRGKPCHLLKSHHDRGVLVFHFINSPIVVIMNFENRTYDEIIFPATVTQIEMVSPDLWFVALNRQLYLFNLPSNTMVPLSNPKGSELPSHIVETNSNSAVGVRKENLSNEIAVGVQIMDKKIIVHPWTTSDAQNNHTFLRSCFLRGKDILVQLVSSPEEYLLYVLALSTRSYRRIPLGFYKDGGRLLPLSPSRVLIATKSGFCVIVEVDRSETDKTLAWWTKVQGKTPESSLQILFDGGELSAIVDQISGIGEGASTGQGEGSTKPKSSSFHGPRKDDQPIDWSKHKKRQDGELQNLKTLLDKASDELRAEMMTKRLSDIKMSPVDAVSYNKIASRVQRQIQELRTLLQSSEAKKKERSWIYNQTTGDLDERKLIDGIAGEKAVYKRRGKAPPALFSVQPKPKRILFSLDISASMAKYNGHDGRLDRTLEVAFMVMNAFKDFDYKYEYELSGHSGDSANIPILAHPKYPQNEKEIFDVLQLLRAHATHCIAGDNTLKALNEAIERVQKDGETDESFVILTSDANILQYGINPDDLTHLVREASSKQVFVALIFIGTLEDQAQRLKEGLPSGHGFICQDASELPKVMQQIFTSSLLKDTPSII